MIFDILTLKPFHILPRGPLVAIYIRITFFINLSDCIEKTLTRCNSFQFFTNNYCVETF